VSEEQVKKSMAAPAPINFAAVTIKYKSPLTGADRDERIRFSRSTTEQKLQALLRGAFGLPNHVTLSLRDTAGCLISIDENLPDGEIFALEVVDKSSGGKTCKICGYDDACFKVKHNETVDYYKDECPDLQIGDLFCRSCYMKWYQKANPLKRKQSDVATPADQYAELLHSPKQHASQLVNTDSPVIQKLLAAQNVGDVPLGGLLSLVHSATPNDQMLQFAALSTKDTTPSRKKIKDEKKICSICGTEVPGKCYRMKESMIDYYVNHLKLVEAAQVDAILCDPCYRKWQRHRQKEVRKIGSEIGEQRVDPEDDLDCDDDESEKRQAEIEKLRHIPKWSLAEFEELRGKRKLRVAAMLQQLDIRKKLESRKHEGWAKYLDRCTKDELEKRLQQLLEQESSAMSLTGLRAPIVQQLPEEEQIAFGMVTQPVQL